MYIIYGSPLCPDCVNCKANFDHYGIPYEFRDITANLKYLKAFVKLRETLPLFDRCKEIDDLGLPTLIDEEGNAFLSWEKMLLDQGKEVFDVAGASCSLDHKGC